MRRSLLSLGPIVSVLLLSAAVGQPPQPPQPPQQPGGPRGPGGPPPRFHPLIALLDTDGDGVLSQAEIEGASAKLKQLDRNQDGKLALDEVGPRFPGPRPPGERPPGERPPGGRPPGIGRPGMERVGESDFATPPLAKDDTERRILEALEQMRQGPRFANVSPTDGRLLRLLTEAVDAKRVVEIGTSTGESAVYFGLALKKTGGHLFTHEIDPERARIAQENFKRAGVDDVITVVVGDAHETVKRYQEDKEPIDILFLDADKEGYIDYLEKLLPLIRPGGLITAHNMNPRQADARYVKAITQDPNLETSFLLMEGAGVGVTLKKR